MFLFNHSRLWRMHKTQNEFDWFNSWHENERIGHEKVIDVQLYLNDNQICTGALACNLTETAYIAAFWIGLTVSILSLFLAVWLLWWERRKINKMAL